MKEQTSQWWIGLGKELEVDIETLDEQQKKVEIILKIYKIKP